MGMAMSWILGLVGALLGALFAAADDTFFGLVAGALVGALLGQASRLRGRVSALEARLAQFERQAPGAAAAAIPARAAVPPASTEPTHAASPPASVTPPATEVAAIRPEPAPTAGPPPVPQTPHEGPQPEPKPKTIERRGPDVFEKALAMAKRWLFEGNVPVKLGLLVLMFGVAAALKYAADAGWLRLPIEFRLAGIAAAAIAGLVWGLRTARERPAFGLSLQGGAIGVLLLTVFAAYRYYSLIAPLPAFVLVVVLVAGASVLAVRQNAVALAVPGFIGGYLAPVLISTGSGNHVALFSYYAVLNAAVLAIAWKRPWRALNLIGFGFTFVVGALWGADFYRTELFATVEPFLVLFFLFYVAIPVLYALAGRGRNAPVDGTLLFGTPLLAFPMQVALLDGDMMMMAVSAVVVAGIYAGLAAWAMRNPRLRLLAQSSAALGVVFATLAIPLALEARWTSAAWALQGAGMVWLGLRQSRRLLRWTGLALLALAGLAWTVSVFDTHPFTPDRLLFNGHALNLALLALATLAASWLYDRASGHRVIAILLMLAGLFWWLLLGLRETEVNIETDNNAIALAVFAAITAALAGLLRSPLSWPRLSWPVMASAVASLLLLMVGMEVRGSTWFAGSGLWWWAVVAALLLSLRLLLRDPPSRGLPVVHVSVLAMLSLGLGVSLHRFLSAQALGDGWVIPGSLLPLALLFAGAWRRPWLAAWPVAAVFAGWRKIWLAIAGTGLGLAWLIMQFQPGTSTPLPWLPILNPLELSLLVALVAGVAALRTREARGAGKSGWWPWAAAALLTLTMSVLRACHQLADLPWSLRLLESTLAQTSLTVAWCIAGVFAWILGSRRHNRPMWWIGASLLAVVLLKLLVVDRQFIGNLTGIVSFVVVGLLLIVVGRIAPTPPRPEPK
jgi:uncharacterized membrane protein